MKSEKPEDKWDVVEFVPTLVCYKKAVCYVMAFVMAWWRFFFIWPLTASTKKQQLKNQRQSCAGHPKSSITRCQDRTHLAQWGCHGNGWVTSTPRCMPWISPYPGIAPPCPENSNMQQKRWRKPRRNQHIPEERSLLTWHSLAIWKTQGTSETNLRKIDLKLQIKMIYINILGIMHRYKLGRPVQVSGTPLSINSVMNHL